MTNVLRSAVALPRRLLQTGAAGDAGSAGATLIASNVVIQIAARVVTMAIGVLTAALTARTLKTGGYGVWSGVSSYTGLFAVLTDLGFVRWPHSAWPPNRSARRSGSERSWACASRSRC